MAARGEIRVYKTVQAAALWRKMLTMLFETGHPWITFKDPCNIRSPQDHVGVVHSSNLCTEITLNTQLRRDGGLQPRLGQPARATSSTARLDEARAGARRSRPRSGCSTTSSTSTSTRRRKREQSNLRHRPIGPGHHGLPGRAVPARPAVRLGRRRSSSPIAMMEAGVATTRFSARRGWRGSAAPTRRYHGSKWDRGLFPIDTLDLLERERGMPIDVPRDGAARLGAGARARAPARHAQLEHDGDCADRDDREHRRLLPVHRADLQEHLRQGEHLRRVHDRQRLPGARPEGARAVDRRDARSAEVLRRQRADDRGHSRRPQGEVPRGVRDRSDRGAAV